MSCYYLVSHDLERDRKNVVIADVCEKYVNCHDMVVDELGDFIHIKQTSDITEPGMYWMERDSNEFIVYKTTNQGYIFDNLVHEEVQRLYLQKFPKHDKAKKKLVKKSYANVVKDIDK